MKKKPNAICPLCWGLTTSYDREETCPFCNSELCATSYYEPLKAFLEKRSFEELDKQLMHQKAKIKATHWWRDRRHRFYLKDFLKSIEKVIKLKRELEANRRWILIYNDTLSGESYRLPKEYRSEEKVREATKKAQEKIQKKNPDSRDWVSWQELSSERP